MRISDWSSDVCSSDLAMPFGSDKPGAREDAKVRRHGVLGDVELVGDFASGQPIRLVAHEKTEGVETRRLRERAESGNGRVIFHISSITDISCRTSWVRCWMECFFAVAVRKDRGDRKSGWTGTGVEVRVDRGGRR